MEPLCGLVPGEPLDDDHSASISCVARFLHQNGFSAVGEVDDAGWMPIHYAALGGDALVVQGLLKQRADPNSQTRKSHAQVGIALWTSVLGISLFFTQNAVVRVLLEARARIEGGLQPALLLAAMGDNAEGIRLLCAARAQLRSTDMFLGT